MPHVRGTSFVSSDRKPKRDAKPKKAKVDHLEHIPFKLREIMKSKEAMKSGAPKAKKAKKGEGYFIRVRVVRTFFCLVPVVACDHNDFSATREQISGDIPVPHFKRGKRESVKAYVQRMENETKHVLFLSKNQVDRKPELELDLDNQGAAKGKTEKKKEYVVLSFILDVTDCPTLVTSSVHSAGMTRLNCSGFIRKSWTGRRPWWKRRCLSVR